MNPAPPPPPYAPPAASTPADDQQLGLLSILFYVYSAVVALAALIFVGGAIVGLAIIPGMPRGRGQPDPAMLGGAIALIFGAAAVLLVAKTVMMILTARAFGRRQGYVTCMIGACLAMTNIPLGTALGIFAMVTLQKPDVKARLQRA